MFDFHSKITKAQKVCPKMLGPFMLCLRFGKGLSSDWFPNLFVCGSLFIHLYCSTFSTLLFNCVCYYSVKKTPYEQWPVSSFLAGLHMKHLLLALLLIENEYRRANPNERPLK